MEFERQTEGERAEEEWESDKNNVSSVSSENSFSDTEMLEVLHIQYFKSIKSLAMLCLKAFGRKNTKANIKYRKSSGKSCDHILFGIQMLYRMDINSATMINLVNMTFENSLPLLKLFLY